MFVAYLTSVIVFMVAIVGTAYLFENRIRENGWHENVKKTNKNPWLIVFFMSAIPVLRAVFFIAEIIMIAGTKEEIDELIEDLKEEL